MKNLWTLLGLLFALTLNMPAHAASAGGLDCYNGRHLYEAGQKTEAFRVFMHCALFGDAESQYSAAMMMRSGELSEEGWENHHGARRFLEASAAQGYGHAVYALALEHETGSPAFRRDLSHATELFRQASELGVVDAQVDLATQYYLGRGGVPQDYAQAAAWYERAARAGHYGAQFMLASLYEHGDGVAQDYALAIFWYQRAQAGGDQAAPYKAALLRSRLQQQQTAEFARSY